MYFATGQSYLFTLHLKYSIIHFNVTIIFNSTSKLRGRFALKWIRPRLLRPHLLKLTFIQTFVVLQRGYYHARRLNKMK